MRPWSARAKRGETVCVRIAVAVPRRSGCGHTFKEIRRAAGRQTPPGRVCVCCVSRSLHRSGAPMCRYSDRVGRAKHFAAQLMPLRHSDAAQPGGRREAAPARLAYSRTPGRSASTAKGFFATNPGGRCVRSPMLQILEAVEAGVLLRQCFIYQPGATQTKPPSWGDLSDLQQRPAAVTAVSGNIGCSLRSALYDGRHSPPDRGAPSLILPARRATRAAAPFLQDSPGFERTWLAAARAALPLQVRHLLWDCARPHQAATLRRAVRSCYSLARKAQAIWRESPVPHQGATLGPAGA